MRYRAKHLIEYSLLRFFTAILNAMPYRVALLMVWGMAWLAFNIVRFRRKEAIRRILEVFGDSLTKRQARRIAWLSMRNMAFNIVEMTRGPKFDKAWFSHHLPGFAEEAEIVRKLVEEHGGAVIAVPHMGNWDLAGWGCNQHGIRMFSVAAKQKNPLVNNWITRQREIGMTVLERGSGTLKQVVRLLRSGNALAILPDVRVYNPDFEVSFLGGTANLGRGMAMFAIAAKVPVIPAILWRQGWSRHRFERLTTIYPNPAMEREQDALRITKLVIESVDHAIRQAPEQWFWYNKRWVLAPLKKQRDNKQNERI